MLLLFNNERVSEHGVSVGLTIKSTHLDGLVVFLTVAELRGFRAAARRLGMTPSAVSQRIRSLEERVGVSLFSRTTRSIALTEAGERLLAHTRPALQMLGAGIEAASGLGDEVSGQLRINAPRAALPLFIERLLPGLLEAHPKLRVELVGEDRRIDIIEEGFDAGIRFGHLVEPGMIATPLTPPDRYVVVGAPSYLQKSGRPRHPEELEKFSCIGFCLSPQSVEAWRFMIDGKPVLFRVGCQLTTNDIEASLRAALRGVGLFLVARSVVLGYLQTGQLETVLDAYSVELPGLSLYYPSQSRSLPKLRAFLEFARSGLRAGEP